MKNVLIGFVCLLSMLVVGCTEAPLHLREENSFQSTMMSEKTRHEVDKFYVALINNEVVVLEGGGMGARLSSEDTLFRMSENEIIFTYGDNDYYVDITNLSSEKLISFDRNNLLPKSASLDLYERYNDSNQ